MQVVTSYAERSANSVSLVNSRESDGSTFLTDASRIARIFAYLGEGYSVPDGSMTPIFEASELQRSSP